MILADDMNHLRTLPAMTNSQLEQAAVTGFDLA
jgi:hypothetical protein